VLYFWFIKKPLKSEAMKTIYFLPVIVLFSMFWAYTYSQEFPDNLDTSLIMPDEIKDSTGNELDLFASEVPLEMTLSFDMKAFIRSKNKPEYQPGVLTVKLSNTDSITQKIKLKARGFMRRSYCYFPPIMLKFKKNPENESRQVMDEGKLKLVTHCNRSSLFESYVFKEYLTYKLFNQVTPYSFKTRLVKITYVDNSNAKEPFTAYGFLIENENKLAERNNSVVVNTLKITQKNMNSHDMARVAVFNYMIGNLDWSVPLQHNVKVIKTIEMPSDKAIPVAYDFDYSGLVNTVYSAPPEELPVKTVTERYYLGLCLGEDELKPVLEEFSGLKDKFMMTVDNFTYLSKSDKNQVESYINSFYKMYKSKSYLISELNRTCKRI
jgi:hypothetical protein